MWVVSAHTHRCAQSALSWAQPQHGEGGIDANSTHQSHVQSKAEGARHGERGSQGPPVTRAFPDTHLANRGDGESFEVEVVNRSGDKVRLFN